MNAVVTELTIDARGSQAGSSSYIQAMTAAQAAVDRFMDRQRAMDTATVSSGAVMERSATSTAAAARALDRLKASIDPTFVSARALEHDIVTLDRAVTHLGVSEAEAGRMLDAVRLKHDAVAMAAKRQTEEYLQLAAAGRQSFAADQNQRNFTSFMGVRDPAMMAGSARASASAFMDMPGQAGEAAQQVGLASHQVTNLTYQMNDMAMMLASGQSPFIMMMQQGSQVSQIFGDRGLRDIIPALGTAITSLISPTMLFLAGVTAAGYAGYYAFREIVPEAKSAEEVLERQVEILKELGDAYEWVGAASEKAFSRTPDGIDFNIQRSINELELLLKTQDMLGSGGVFGRGGGSFGHRAEFNRGTGITTFGVDPGEFERYEEPILRLNEQARNGVANFEEFREEVLRLWRLDPSAEATDTAKFILDQTEQALRLTKAYQEAKAAQDALVGGGPRGPAADAQAEWSRRNREELFNIERQRDLDLAGIGLRSPQELADHARRSVLAEPMDPQEDSRVRSRRADIAAELALAEAQHGLAEAQRDRARSLDATMAAQELDLSLIGQTVGEVERLRMEFDLTQQLREEAARNNIAVDEREIALIKEKAAAYGLVAEQIARATLRDDLAFERQQLFRSPVDQQIASRLRGSGADLNSDEARMMRENMRFEELRDGVDGFVTDFRAKFLENGGDLGDAFGDAVLNAFNKQIDKWADQGIDLLSSAIAGAFGMGGGAGTAGAGGAVAAATAAGVSRMFSPANDNSVLRMPLPDIAFGGMSAYREAISSIESGGRYDALGPWTKGDRAYGRYQVMGANVGPWSEAAIGRRLSPSQFLADPAAQDSIFDHRFGGYVDRYGASGAAQAWFGGPGSVGRGGNAADILGTTGSAYVDKFNDALGNATKNLAGFGGGLGELGQALMNVGGGAGGGGWFSGLMGMFGGAGGATSWMNKISPLATAFLAGGGVGLFAEGGVADRPSIFGEVPGRPEAAVPLSRGRYIPVEIRMPAAPRVSMGGAAGVHVTLGWEKGSNGNIEPVIRSVVQKEAPGIAQQQSTQTVAEYDDRQRRGGVMANNRSYQALKRR